MATLSLMFFSNGFLIASIIFYFGFADMKLFHNDTNFWCLHLSIVLFCSIICTLFPVHGHIFGCTFMAAYFCIAALSNYIGGTLNYIMINIFRRIVVRNFNIATIDPPHGYSETWQVLVWIWLLYFGIWFQLKFKECPPSLAIHSPSERRYREANEYTSLLIHM